MSMVGIAATHFLDVVTVRKFAFVISSVFF